MIDLSVKTFKPSRSPFFKAWWTDPETGQRREKSTKTKSSRAAERFAARLETELRNGTYADPSRISWEVFRERYETEVLAGLAEKTGLIVATVFNIIEDVISPTLLRQVDANAISRMVKTLRGRQLSESSIKAYLSHLRSALNWGVRMKLLPALPEITMPKRAKRSKLMKGRPITTEEFERMLAAVSNVLVTEPRAYMNKAQRQAKAEFDAKMVESWKFFLRGLWTSGLRIGEAMELWWDRDDRLSVDFSGRRPMLRISAESEKGNTDRLLPIVPEFAELLDTVPDDERTGRIFTGLARRIHSDRLLMVSASAIISDIGKRANVKVHTNAKTGKVKFASAHDLRRSFGERWAMRIMPQVLMELMRHESMETTLRFYVGRNAQKAADAVWEATEAMRGDDIGDGRRISEFGDDSLIVKGDYDRS
jgi:integrase